MLDLIIQMLEVDDYIGVSKTIDFAKGVNEIPFSVKKWREQDKRIKQWQ
jgi:hypothetical protein